MKVSRTRFGLAVALILSSPLLGNSVVEEEWPRESSKACLDYVLGGKRLAAEASVEGLSVVVIVLNRCGRSHELLLRSSSSGSSLDFVSAYKLRETLDHLRSRNTFLSFAAACDQAGINRQALRGETARLDSLTRRLRELRISPVVDSPFVVHGALYEVSIFHVVGFSRFVYQSADGAGHHQNLQGWVEDLLDTAGFPCQQ